LHGRVYGRCWMECGTMEWKLNWRFWRAAAGDGCFRGSAGGIRKEPRTLNDWEVRLVEQGVSNERASRIAAQLAPAYAELGRGSAAVLLRGVMLAVEDQTEERVGVDRSLRDVREVERLLGAFSGELEKLDEVLEVLSAYAQRMRTNPNRPPDRTLH